MKKTILFCILAACNVQLFAQQTNQHVVELKWLDTTKFQEGTGVSWGVPWPRGAVKKNQSFTLTTNDGNTIPVQSWPLAYWPDGTIKWTGFAAVPPVSQSNFQTNR